MSESGIRWTNSSVRAFSGSSKNPVEVMESRVRTLVLESMDKGWSGPPYDPIRLAQILHYEIEASRDVKEARVSFSPSGRFKIEFNPMRPKGRIYFSVAHEIAHTLFPDCKSRVRHREMHEHLERDDWQIEALCNLGAAEILMPVGSFSELRRTHPSIEELLNRQKDLQVSTEALLVRYAKLSDTQCAVFCASRSDQGRSSGRYRLDYLVPSRTWHRKIVAGRYFAENSPVSECVAIGYTAKGKEIGLDDKPLLVEAVGLAPYPGQVVPRVAGIIRELQGKVLTTPSINYVRGDALEPRGPDKKIIAHIINDKTPRWGGVSFASAARKKWPNVHRAFLDRVLDTDRQVLKLGATTALPVSDKITLFNIVAQHGFGPSSSPRIRYAALRSGLEQLSRKAQESDATVHMPRIGTGNAGGSWDVIEEMIMETLLSQRIPVTVYDLPS